MRLLKAPDSCLIADSGQPFLSQVVGSLVAGIW